MFQHVQAPVVKTLDRTSGQITIQRISIRENDCSFHLIETYIQQI